MKVKNITQVTIILCVLILIGCAGLYTLAGFTKENIPKNIPVDVRNEIEQLYSSDAIDRGMAVLKLGLMGQKAAPAIQFLIDLFDDDTKVYNEILKKRGINELAAQALGEIGEAGIDTLIALSKDKDSNIRALAAMGLGSTYSKYHVRTLEPLITALKDEAGYVRWRAAEALGEIGDTRAVEPLITALKDDTFEVRGRAAEALGKIGDTRAVEPLIIALKGDTQAVDQFFFAASRFENRISSVRYEAATALKKIGDPRAIEPLVAVLKNNNSHVRLSAAEVLDGLNWVPQTQQQRIFYLIALAKKKIKKKAPVGHSVPQCWKDLVQIGQPAVEPLIAALKDEDFVVRMDAAWALGKIGDTRAVDPLIAALSDENYDVRVSVTVALIRIDDARAVEPLIAKLKDENPDVRKLAAVVLGKTGDARAVEPLITALKDKSESVRGTAASELRKITEENFGQDQTKWQEWWDKNKDEVLKNK